VKKCLNINCPYNYEHPGHFSAYVMEVLTFANVKAGIENANVFDVPANCPRGLAQPVRYLIQTDLKNIIGTVLTKICFVLLYLKELYRCIHDSVSFCKLKKISFKSHRLLTSTLCVLTNGNSDDKGCD